MRKFRQALDATNLDWHMVVYAGARHSFTNPGADVHGIDALKVRSPSRRCGPGNTCNSFLTNSFRVPDRSLTRPGATLPTVDKPAEPDLSITPWICSTSSLFVLTLTAGFSYLNYRFIRLPVTIGVMVIALAGSLLLHGIDLLGYHVEALAARVA